MILTFDLFHHLPLKAGSCGGLDPQDPCCFTSLELQKHSLEKAKSFLDTRDLVIPSQTHSCDVLDVSSVCSVVCDGLVTHYPLGLMIRHADCQAAVFYDPKKHLLAVVHAGWKGLVQNIYAKTLEKMSALGSLPENILVAIAPSLGPCHSEFKGYQEIFPKHFWGFKDHKDHFNLWEIATMQLSELGIQSNHLEIKKVCTVCDARWHSYRRNHTTQRNATFARLLAPKVASEPKALKA